MLSRRSVFSGGRAREGFGDCPCNNPNGAEMPLLWMLFVAADRQLNMRTWYGPRLGR
jgi:hypothetical protein